MVQRISSSRSNDRIDPEQAGPYLPAMPFDTLVGAIRGLFERLVRYDFSEYENETTR